MITKRKIIALSITSLVTAAGIASPAIAQEYVSFSGPYFGLEFSRQNVIAGALVAGVDMLAQSSRNLPLLNSGYRYQFRSGLVIGAEVSYGGTATDLGLSEPAYDLTIDYKGNTQFSFGGVIGYAGRATRETLIYAYLSETKRTFDVTIRGPLGVGTQTDKQGLLRYGLGLERRLTGPISIRASLGSSRADFGGRLTNIDPETKIDVVLGVQWQFRKAERKGH